jgi:hypothetical protein
MEENLQNGAAYEKICWYSSVILAEPRPAGQEVRTQQEETEKKQGEEAV